MKREIVFHFRTDPQLRNVETSINNASKTRGEYPQTKGTKKEKEKQTK